MDSPCRFTCFAHMRLMKSCFMWPQDNLFIDIQVLNYVLKCKKKYEETFTEKN